MAKVVSLLCAMLLMFIATPPAAATPVTGVSCVAGGESLEYLFTVWGESEHWALLLQGLGNCQGDRIHLAKALPYLVWTGGGKVPERASITFTVRDVTCVKGTVGVQSFKVVRVANCKLVYPGQGLLVAKGPEDLVQDITSDGRFVISWDDMTEEITWRYGYLPPTRPR